MKTFFNKLHYQPISVKNLPFILIFSIFSVFYCIIVYIRILLYKYKIIKSKRLAAYTVSIGNLTTGGTGKTPITCEIANYLSNTKNKKVAIISRGYGGKLPNEKTNVITNGEKTFYNAEMAGDEPYWMAENTENVAVITGKNRVASGKYAINELNSEFLILDDGFQHIKVEKDINILLIDLFLKFGNNFLLPAGPLREPVEQITKADKVVIVNKKPFNTEANAKYEKLSKWITNEYNKPCFLCNLEPGIIYDVKTNQPVSRPEKALVFTGIGQPEFFFNSVQNLGIQPVYEKTYPDHHSYTKEDLDELIFLAKKHGAKTIITTEKDSVKITNFLNKKQEDIAVCALKLKVNLDIENLLEIK